MTHARESHAVTGPVMPSGSLGPGRTSFPLEASPREAPAASGGAGARTRLRRLGAAWTLGLAAAACAVGACGPDEATGVGEPGDPLVSLRPQDPRLAPGESRRVLAHVLSAVPGLRDLRARDERANGGPVRLNLVLQSAADPDAPEPLDRTHHTVWVNTHGPEGLISTATFTVRADLSSIEVFDATGDRTEPVARWLEQQGLPAHASPGDDRRQR